MMFGRHETSRGMTMSTHGALAWIETNDSNISKPISTDPFVTHGADLHFLLDKEQVFFGFDEVWFTRELPTKRFPSSAAIAGPIDFGRDVPGAVKEACDSQDAVVAMGDGFGLNICVRGSQESENLGLQVVGEA
jgi:hypothetical protein